METNNDFYTDIYELRMLVFIETEPQSNKYRQILLSPETYKEITGLIVKETEEEDVIEYKASEEIYELPDLKSVSDCDRESQ